MCSRDSYEATKKYNVVGFHDRVSVLNNRLADVSKGDKLYFYITKEMLLEGVASVTKEIYLDDTPLFTSKTELFAKRLGVTILKDTLHIPFVEKVVPKLKNLFPPNSPAIWSAYLVMQFIKLSEEDSREMEKLVGSEF